VKRVQQIPVPLSVLALLPLQPHKAQKARAHLLLQVNMFRYKQCFVGVRNLINSQG
jgi:hypothetical protein